MATIRNRGEYQWEVQIRRKGYPAQRKTFETKADAQAWARMIESEMDRGVFVSRAEAERTLFSDLIDRYITEVTPKHKGAYSEVKRLEALKRHPLAGRIVATLTSSDFRPLPRRALEDAQGQHRQARASAVSMRALRLLDVSGASTWLTTPCEWPVDPATTTNVPAAWLPMKRPIC